MIIHEKSLKNEEGPNADPGDCIDKLNKKYLLSTKSPGETKQGVTLIQGEIWRKLGDDLKDMILHSRTLLYSKNIYFS